MSNHAVMPLSDYVDVCDAIRDKMGTTDTIVSGELSDKVNEVYDKGRTDEWSDFWDNYQYNGTRRIYDTAFGTYDTVVANGWNDNNFYPKYPIIATNLCKAFKACDIRNLKERLEECGVYLDTSECGNFNQTFSYTWALHHIPELDMRKATNVTVMFNRATGVHTIDKLILSENNTLVWTESFHYCEKLVNVKFEGKINRTINFSFSPLSVESMKSIISCLKDYSTTSTGVYTVSFTEACWTALESDSSAPDGGTWREYVEYKLGWNT